VSHVAVDFADGVAHASERAAPVACWLMRANHSRSYSSRTKGITPVVACTRALAISRNEIGTLSRRAGQHSCAGLAVHAATESHSLLELHRRDVAQGRVQPAAVVDLVDEARKARDDLIEGLIVAEVNLLALERLHETLCLAYRTDYRTAPSSPSAHEQPIRCDRATRRDRNDVSCPVKDGAR
jgi:hypothetical protein